MKRNIDGIRENTVLEAINKFRVLTVREIAFLGGYKDTVYPRRICKTMVENGLLYRTTYLSNKLYFYTLTSKAIKKIGSEIRPYQISPISAIHEVFVAKIACYLCLEYDLNIDDMITDRDTMLEIPLSKRKKNAVHIADIRVPHLKLAVEYERTDKSYQRFEKNFNKLLGSYDKILWVVPKENNVTLSRISKIIKNNEKNTEVVVLFEEDIEDKLKAFSLKENKLRRNYTRKNDEDFQYELKLSSMMNEKSNNETAQQRSLQEEISSREERERTIQMEEILKSAKTKDDKKSLFNWKK